ncbi:DASH family cryptochrome [Rheinheimera sp. EpRS3]|uniref:DASH family cryptochrome n=1 Tax=Rheinheimera sp. EpRS3 TaxID=1712383 RepID=UPI000749CF0E|nr:DASH family cryptochrome [Rheinheimera sp. EpRS3]KUM54413.1 DASH family cryptochrome [Rheinheimera sp. EpRS3]
MSISLILLNNTLRWHDNPLLNACEGRKAAVIVLNKAAFFGRQYGLPRANLQRLQQQIAVIAALKNTLAAKHIGLITLVGDTVSCIRTLADELKAEQLYCAEPVASYEYAAINRLKQTLNVTQLDSNSLLSDGLRPNLAKMPDSFTPFRKQREPLLQVSEPAMQAPDQNWLLPAQTGAYNSAFIQLSQQYHTHLTAGTGSEASALARLQHYIWQQQHILHYKQTRNQLMGGNYASFFSVPLSLGSLSVRFLWQQIVSFEQQVQANDSTYWLKFELLWREFFRWQFRKYGSLWFSKDAIKGRADFSQPQLSKAQLKQFNLWCQGNTGEPFIDANMRLLNQTGLMSNRGRQNVASYLLHNLDIDWRLGAAYFEQRLLDYDCASNWGNWAYIAGTGNSAQRQFNISKQAQMYDPQGAFVKAMLPSTLS